MRWIGSQGLAERRRIGLVGRGYVLTANSLSGAGLGFVFWIVAARRFAVTDVGFAAALVSAAVVVSGIGTVGLSSGLPRFIPVTERWAGLVVRGYAAAIAATAALAVSTTFALSRLDDSFARLAELGWLVLFVGCCVAWTVFSLQDFVLIAREQVTVVAVENSVVGVLRVLAVLVVGAEHGASALLLAWLVPTVLAAVAVNAWILLPAARDRVRGRRQGLPELASFARYCSVAALGTAATVIVLSLMPSVVTAVEGAEANARFFLPWSLSIALQAVAAGMAAPLLPALAARSADDREATLKVLTHTGVVIVGLGLPIVICAPFALAALGSSYEVDSGLIALLVAAAVLASLTAVLLARARAHNWLGQVVLVQWSVAAALVGGAVVLLPELGLHGVGWAALAAQSLGLALAISRQRLVVPLVRLLRGGWRSLASNRGPV